MSLLSPIHGTLRGGRAFLRGLVWLKAHPGYLALLFIPMALGLTVLVSGWGLFYHYSDQFFDWVMFAKPEAWWGVGLYYLTKGLLYSAVLLVGLITYSLAVNVLASPIYDHVSLAVERQLSTKPVEELGFVDSLKLIGEEFKKFLFILSLSLAILVVPGVNVLAPLVAAFCVGWDLYDYPFARRGWRFRTRAVFALQHLWSILGLGLWLLIPGLQMFLMPLAVVGGTILAVEDLEHSALKRKEA